MINAICLECSNEEREIVFPSVRELAAHRKGGHAIMPKVEAEKPAEVVKTADNPPSSTPVPEKKPIILKYKYEGSHDCGNALDTIQIPVKGRANMCVAYCPNCRVQVTSQEVIQIEAQEELLKQSIVVEKKNE